MSGGDLRFHITRKTFTEEAVRFWIAELGCALRYIHKQGIVHRDVKPDNVLLDLEGHVHLADFNVASDYTPNKPLSSRSGTLAYLAPEVYTGRGYLSEVDWWSLGVTFYECIFNKRPFEAKDHEALAQAIVKAEPPFPTTTPPVSNVCLHAISSLLEKEKHKRIGAAGFETFVDNPFFREIDFAALERKEIEPVFCPSSEKANFDATYDLEELLLEEAPLEARSRKQRPRAGLRDDATKQEIRADELHKMIETMFQPFNYTLLPQERAPLPPSGLPTKEAPIEPRDAEPMPSRRRRSLSRHKSYENPLDPPRSLPSPRSQTPVRGGRSRNRSPTQSPHGSPPLPVAVLSGDQEIVDYFPQRTTVTDTTSKPIITRTKPPPNFSRVTSAPMSSDLLIANNAVGAHTGPAKQANLSTSSGSPTDGEFKRGDRPTGMLGFLSRKKGRDKSPKAKERGVLGKEGARVVVKEPKG